MGDLVVAYCVSFVALIATSFIGLAVCWIWLRLLDRVTFEGEGHVLRRRIIPKVAEQPMALAVYLGARFLAVAVLVGMLFGRVV